MNRSDDQLRALLADAHRDDAPPSFAALTARARRKRRPIALLVMPVLVAAAILLWMRPRPPVPAPELVRIEFHDPLAFLLEPPGAMVLGTVPQFDNGGELP